MTLYHNTSGGMDDEKKNFSVGYGGVIAVGALSLHTPVAVQAEETPYCGWKVAPHIEKYDVTTVNGQLTVTINVKTFEGGATGFNLFAFEKPLEGSESPGSSISKEAFMARWNELGGDDPTALFGKKNSGTYTFTGLTGGKTYYVYCTVLDTHDESKSSEEDDKHTGAMYLGSGTPTATTSSGSASHGSTSRSSSKTAWASYEDKVTDRIQEAKSGSTVVMEEGITTISNSMMKELLKKGDVSLKLTFTYKEKDYVIIIPAGEALDNDIPWYGPLYLAQHFGNKA